MQGSWVRAPAGAQIALVVQLVERLLWEQEAAGPSPATQTNNGTVAQW